MHRVLVDNGSSADILYYPAFQQMMISKERLTPTNAPLVGFGGTRVFPLGAITLSVTVGDYPRQITRDVTFLVVDCSSAYNAILGRPTLNAWKAATSTYHLMIKFPTEYGVGELRGNQVAARECYLAMIEMEDQRQAMCVEEQRFTAEPVEESEEFALDESRPERTTRIGTSASRPIQQALKAFLRMNQDVFAWSHEDMPGISRSVMVHKLNVNPNFSPVRQKKRVFAQERDKAIAEEVKKLLEADFIREVYYPDWLANVVMVKKANGKWRMCVDFTDLNKACPKDSYPLPRIDTLMDSTAKHQLLSFMDAFSGYNQIKMDEADQEKTSFVTSQGLFCYNVMPFGLKNAGATYQRLMNKMFAHQIGRNVQVYVDDMLVKSLREQDHLKDLQETFNTLRSYNMKLNPSKCVFGVTAGKFLGFMVSHRGIEVNPEKVRAIMELKPPKSVKEMQSLNGRIAALNRFVSKATDKCLPFFRTLRKAFEWTEECQAAFESLKKYLASPPLLSPAEPGEELYLYLAVSQAAVSAALIREEQGTQLPVYYISRGFRGAEERYPQIEKLAFALITAARKLKPYFQAHTIVVLTDQPLKRAMSSPEAAGRMALWAIELSEFDVQYRPRTAIKGQAAADFIAEYTKLDDKGADTLREWSIHTDGSSNKQAGGVGVVIRSPDGDKIECMIQLDYATTNNEAEYEALVAGLDLAVAAGAEVMVIHCDSQVITSQINGIYECKNERMKKYLEKVKSRINGLKVRFIQIPREENECADRLARAASAEPMQAPNQVLSFIQTSSTIDDGAEVRETNSENDWTTPLLAYLRTGALPDGKEAARKLRVQASRFVLIKNLLYKRGFSRPYLRCLNHDESNYVMREVHEGVCGNHSGARSLVHKLIRAGYYWPTMQKDAQSFVKRCDKCQRFSNLIRQPTEEMTPITAPWPFAQWGLDIMGPFPTAAKQLKFLVVGIDYFTKWVEAEALATITERNIRNFVWRNIICRYGIPRVLVSDNGKQFDNSTFRNFCSELGIKNHYSSPAHPQANGQVEVTNRTLLKIIKARLEGAKGIWPDELPSVLWAYRTTVRVPTGETPFRLAYGTDAVIPVEIGLTSYRVENYSENDNDEGMRLQLDLVDEVRATAEQRLARYQNLMAKYYNSNVRQRDFQIGDLVLRKVMGAARDPSQGKLGPNWEGPYRILSWHRKGTYHLETLDGQKLQHPWNTEHLRRYYQ